MIDALVALAWAVSAQEIPRAPMRLSAWIVPWDRADASGADFSCFSEINPFAFILDEAGAPKLAHPELMLARAADRLVIPVVVNDVVDRRGRVEEKSPAALDALLERGIEGIVAALPLDAVDGVELDFERVPIGAWPRYADFLDRLAAALHAKGKRLSIDVEAAPLFKRDGGRGTIGEAARAVDAVKVMAYYQRGSWTGEDGPGSSISWIEDVARRARAVVPREKLWVALSLAGSDWLLPEPRVASVRRVTRLHYGKVQALLAARAGKPGWSEREQAPFLDYEEDGRRHRLWYEDERSLAAKLDALRGAGIARAAIWYVGKKHPGFSTSAPCRR